MDDIMRIIKSLEDMGLLIKGVGKTVKNKAKIQEGGLLKMLLGTLAASILENLLTEKSKTPGQRGIRASEVVIQAGAEKIRACQHF